MQKLIRKCPPYTHQRVLWNPRGRKKLSHPGKVVARRPGKQHRGGDIRAGTLGLEG